MLTSLSLTNYRNFEHFSLTEIPRITVLIGPNGVGKTNILEAIALFGGISLRRKSRSIDMIRQGETTAIVEAKITHDVQKTLRMLIQPKQVQYVIDTTMVPTAQVARVAPSIIFAPETVQLFVGDPVNRRSVLDRILTAISSEYYDSFVQYMRILRQRNAALRGGYVSQLEVWEDELARHATTIILSRHWLLGRLQELMKLPVSITYLPSPRKILPLLDQTTDMRELLLKSSENVRGFLLEAWAGLREREVAVGFSLIGPQRDDWYLDAIFRGNSKYANVGIYASRGQQRLAVIHLQYAALELLHKETGQIPLWLLDDVFSELDEEHQQDIVSLGDKYQMFITTTNQEYAGITRLLHEEGVSTVLLGR